MRLFIAVRLSDAMKDALMAAQDRMAAAGVRGNYTREENLHLTLAFIGEYADSDRVEEAMASVSFSAFPVTLEGLGAFGDLWWAGMQDSPALEAVVRRLRRALAENDIPFDRKRFSPHITLLRKARGEVPGVRVGRCSMVVDTVSLMRSDRGKNGMIYTEIGAITADNGAKPEGDPA